jgi:hypothetical protein
MRMRMATLALAASLISTCPAWAGCKSDYQDAIQDCQMLHDEPDEADDLRLCLEEARDDYEACVG